MTRSGTPLLLTHPACEFHQAPEHPERPERLAAIYEAVAAEPVLGALPRRQPELAGRDRIKAVHDPAYVESIFRAGALADERGLGVWLDPDTWLGPSSLEAAMASAGGAVAGVEAVLAGDHNSAFALTRPPGHHATKRRAMGFCLFNNIALAAQAALDHGLDRVAIVDFDVHHGNGTQEIFWEEPRVLYVSLHEWPLYPGTGRLDETGAGAGAGATCNVPLPAGATGDVYQRAFDEVVDPLVDRFAPDWVLVSCGFDAHRADNASPVSGSARWAS
jgi:acetoin utilization deacetylase AcuC-like enzyme